MSEDTVRSRMTLEEAELIRTLLTSEAYATLRKVIEREIESSRDRLELIGNTREDDMIQKGSLHSMKMLLDIPLEAEDVIVREEQRERVSDEHIEQTESDE